jgi:hypothetical protein
MIAKKARILTLVSCAKMHDHGAVSALWTWEDDDPYALTIHLEGTDEFWQVDVIQFSRALVSCVPGKPITCGVASLQLRLSNPAALSLRLTDHDFDGERYTYLICSVADLTLFLDGLHGFAPKRYAVGVDELLEKIFT